jgi:hypothetical protein
MWAVIFVCHGSRAVYINLTFDNFAESIIGVFTRFIARKGKPGLIRTVNAMHFKAIAMWISE